MDVGSVNAGGNNVDVSGVIAIKVLKQQLDQQAQMMQALTQPTLVYDSQGGVHAVPPQSSFNVTM